MHVFFLEVFLEVLRAKEKTTLLKMPNGTTA